MAAMWQDPSVGYKVQSNSQAEMRKMIHFGTTISRIQGTHDSEQAVNSFLCDSLHGSAEDGGDT